VRRVNSGLDPVVPGRNERVENREENPGYLSLKGKTREKMGMDRRVFMESPTFMRGKRVTGGDGLRRRSGGRNLMDIGIAWIC
jgi:hypothetical protein